MSVRIAWIILLSVLATVAVAKEATPMADDPVLEPRVMALAAELRCLVCQGQSLADSHSDFAIDLRNEIRSQMKTGSTDQQVVAYFVERYGDFIRYSPPMKSTTVALWFGPALLLVITGTVLIMWIKRRKRLVLTGALSAEEHGRAVRLLDNEAKELKP